MSGFTALAWPLHGSVRLQVMCANPDLSHTQEWQQYYGQTPSSYILEVVSSHFLPTASLGNVHRVKNGLPHTREFAHAKSTHTTYTHHLLKIWALCTNSSFLFHEDLNIKLSPWHLLNAYFCGLYRYGALYVPVCVFKASSHKQALGQALLSEEANWNYCGSFIRKMSHWGSSSDWVGGQLLCLCIKLARTWIASVMPCSNDAPSSSCSGDTSLSLADPGMLTHE